MICHTCVVPSTIPSITHIASMRSVSRNTDLEPAARVMMSRREMDRIRDLRFWYLVRGWEIGWEVGLCVGSVEGVVEGVVDVSQLERLISVISRMKRTSRDWSIGSRYVVAVISI